MDEHNSCIFLQCFFHARSLLPLWTVSHSHFNADRFHHNDTYIVIWWCGHNEISILWFLLLLLVHRCFGCKILWYYLNWSYISPVTTCYNSIYIFTGQLKGFTRHLCRINYISISNCLFFFSFSFPFDSSLFCNLIHVIFFALTLFFLPFALLIPHPLSIKSTPANNFSFDSISFMHLSIGSTCTFFILLLVWIIYIFVNFDCFHRWFFLFRRCNKIRSEWHVTSNWLKCRMQFCVPFATCFR